MTKPKITVEIERGTIQRVVSNVEIEVISLNYEDVDLSAPHAYFLEEIPVYAHKEFVEVQGERGAAFFEKINMQIENQRPL